MCETTRKILRTFIGHLTKEDLIGDISCGDGCDNDSSLKMILKSVFGYMWFAHP